VWARAVAHTHTHTHTHTHISLRFVSPLQDAVATLFHWDMRCMTPATRLQTDSPTFVATCVCSMSAREGFRRRLLRLRHDTHSRPRRCGWHGRRGVSCARVVCVCLSLFASSNIFISIELLARVLRLACAHVGQTDKRSTGCQQRSLLC